MLRRMRLAHETKGELETALSLDPKNVDIMRALMEYDWYAPAIGAGTERKRANSPIKSGESIQRAAIWPKQN